MKSMLRNGTFLFLCIASQMPYQLYASSVVQQFSRQSKLTKFLIAGASLYAFTLAQYGIRRTFNRLYTERTALIHLQASTPAQDVFTEPIMIHAHGFGDNATNYKQTQISNSSINNHIVPDFNDDNGRPSALGGPRDRQVYVQAIQVAQKKQNNAPIILKGVSRGGAVATTVDGLYTIKNHVGTIIESGPAHFGDVIEPIVGTAIETFPGGTIVSRIPGLTKFAHAVMNWIPPFWHYRPAGLQPIDVVHRGTQPVLFVASQQDTLIPAANTAKLYLKALAAGREAYLKLLPHGYHANLNNSYVLEQESFIARCLGKATREQIALLKKLKLSANEVATRLAS